MTPQGPQPAEQPPAEQPLTGGLANAGRVVRVGDTVRRPVGPHTPAVHALLDHLAARGFDGAPRVHGFDEQGRAVLSYLPGEVAVPPYPAWAADGDLLVSVARLQRRLHDAVADFTPPDDAAWATTLAAPQVDQPIVGHNDLSLENVVCRDGLAVGFIDFDVAAPTDRLWDVAVALRHWVPVRDPADLDPARREVDQVARFHRYCRAYGLSPGEQARTVEQVAAFLRLALEQMRARAAAGEPAYVAVWDGGYPGLNLRAQEWLARNAAELAG